MYLPVPSVFPFSSVSKFFSTLFFRTFHLSFDIWSSHASVDARRSPTCILPYIIIRDISFPVHFRQFCVSFNVFSQFAIFSLPMSQIFCKDPLKIHFDFDRQPFLLQLLQTCVDSRLICTSTAATLRLHGCGRSFRPTYAHHVTEIPAFNVVGKGVRKGGEVKKTLELDILQNFITCANEINCFCILFAC